MKIQDLPRGASRTNPDDLALIHEKTRVSFSKFYQNVKILSQNFLRLGIHLGDRIAMLSYNGSEILYSFYAVPMAGAIITPFNYAMSPKEIQYCVNDCKPRVIIYQPAFETIIRQLKETGSSIEHYISTDEFPDMLEEAPPTEQKVPHFSHEATAFIIWTGGTTGFPKGVMISHYNMISMIAMAGEMLVKGTDKFKDAFLGSEELSSKMLTALPLFHGAGLFLALCSMFGGITFITQEQFDIIPTLKTIERERATFLGLVPTMLKRLIESPDLKKYDLRSLHTILYGAAPITPTTLGKALDTFPNADFIQVFGQTEASPVLCIMDALDHNRARTNRTLLASCGRPLHGIEVKIVDPFGKEVSRGEVGEIIARGSNIMQGYWGKPEKTAEALRDGWLHTEDLGKIDEDGYIYITGRGKDMIVSGGENIYPIEVEDALQSHPAVLEAGVIGIPDDTWGEKVHAIVVLNKGYESGKNISETELIAHVKKQIASYKAPKSVSFTHALPRSPQGKILKRVLREPYWKGKEREVQ